ncbi:MAG: adenylate/guanylate cyclase domain-containing protein [Nitrososphaeraceae archaeon]
MSTKSEKRITILNLYNSGINPEIIALELDTSKDKVMRVIHEEEDRNSEVKIGASLKSKSKTENLLINKLYLDAVIDIESVLIDSQTRMWKALKVKPEFKISLSETQRILEKFVESKVDLAILHIDLVGSTKMSMTLSIDKLSAIIRAFAQEISLVVSMYGGYVLKYIGDAVLAFFVVERGGKSSNDDKGTISPYSLQSSNVISCACTMIRVIQQGLNPILNQYDYPELQVRIGIDFGEIGVVQYGVDIDELDGKAVFTRPHIDMIGSTISVAVKMTSIAEPDHIVIGEKLYNKLKKKQKEIFKEITGPSSVENYIDEISEGKYHIYESL